MRSHNRWTGMVVGVVMGVLFSGAFVWAGNLEPSVGPTQAGSQMYTLEQIYNRINNLVGANKMATFTEPGSEPTAGTMHTLDEIYALVGLRAPVARTGQTPTRPYVAPAGSDGALQIGVVWPNPRFTDNSNETVTDNLTGLIWLKNANCTNFFFGDGTGVNNRYWPDALTAANSLASGSCGLSDGSTAGQWRLPNVKELLSLIDWAFYDPALSNAAGTAKWVAGDPFTGVQSKNYWSSTTDAGNTNYAMRVDLDHGLVSIYSKTTTTTHYVWPVRGGHASSSLPQ